MRFDSFKIRYPPNHSTITMMIVPKNSDIGWAAFCLIAIALASRRYSSLMLTKRCDIFFSAMKALMIRSPPSVSSSCASMSPHLPWTAADWLFSLRLTVPIIHPAKGATRMTKSVICQLIHSMVEKHTMMAIG